MNTSRAATAEQWRRRMADQKASGLSVAAFCRDQHISENTFYLWNRLLRQGAESGASVAEAKPVASSFIEVKPTLPAGRRFPATLGGEAIGIEIRLDHDRRLLVRPGFDRKLLAGVVGGVGGVS